MATANEVADAALEAAMGSIERVERALNMGLPASEVEAYGRAARDLMVGAAALRPMNPLGHVFTAGGGRYEP